MHAFLLDLRAALRLIRRQPAFSAFVIGILGIGIGSVTAVFTLVHAVLLRDLPFADPDHLVWMYNARTERDRAPLSIPDLNDYQREAATLEGVAPFTNWTANLTGDGDAERLEGTRVAGSFFPLVGSTAMLGRTLEPRDESEGAKVAVITYGLWKRRFGGDAAVVGRPITLNGAAHTIVGVLSPSFAFPFREAEIAVPTALRDDPRRTDRGANFLRVVARLKPGVTIRRAEADLTAIAHRLQKQFPDDDARKTGVHLYSLQSEIVSDYRQILWTLLAAVGVLLATACGNLANLLLVRTAGRRSELALRVSLGASRARVVCQLLAEAGTLAALGGALGLGVAAGAVAGWRAFGPPSFPRMADVAIDVRVLGFAAAAAIGSALVAGLIPAWSGARQLGAALGSDTRNLTASRQHAWARRGFVALQIGASAVLMVAMSLVAQGFARLERVEPGFDPHHALSVQLSLPATRYPTREAIVRLSEAIKERLAAAPGSRAVGAVSLLPLSGLLNTMDVAFPGRPAPPPEEVPQAHFRIASAGYFEAAGIGVLAGRGFSPFDTARSRPVVVVSRTFAERHWPAKEAVGQSLQLAMGAPSPPLEVVGVVSDVKQFTLDRAPTADLYVPLQQMPASQASQLAARMYWVVRTDGDPRRLEAAVRSAVHTVDPDVATSSVRTLDSLVRSSLDGRRLNVRLLEVFGELALVLSALGAYAVTAFSAGARTRELAIRSALGARRSELAGLIVLGELRPVLGGLFAGLAVALGLSRFLAGVVYAISPTDPATYVAVGLGLLAVTAAATYLPARRAGRVDPAALLRGE